MAFERWLDCRSSGPAALTRASLEATPVRARARNLRVRRNLLLIVRALIPRPRCAAVELSLSRARATCAAPDGSPLRVLKREETPVNEFVCRFNSRGAW